MEIQWYLLVGLVLGVLARLILRGKESMGWIIAILPGALGIFWPVVLVIGLDSTIFPREQVLLSHWWWQ